MLFKRRECPLFSVAATIVFVSVFGAFAPKAAAPSSAPRFLASSAASDNACLDEAEVIQRGLAQLVGRQRVTAAAVDPAFGPDNMVACSPAVSTTISMRAWLRQIDRRDGRPDSRFDGLNSVSSPS